MKKAVAYIDKAAIIELLKTPFNVELVGISYPAKDDKVQITLKGDALPVKKSSAAAKRFPEVKYTMLRHWHNAKIEKKDLKNETETES